MSKMSQIVIKGNAYDQTGFFSEFPAFSFCILLFSETAMKPDQLPPLAMKSMMRPTCNAMNDLSHLLQWNLTCPISCNESSALSHLLQWNQWAVPLFAMKSRTSPTSCNELLCLLHYSKLSTCLLHIVTRKLSKPHVSKKLSMSHVSKELYRPCVSKELSRPFVSKVLSRPHVSKNLSMPHVSKKLSMPQVSKKVSMPQVSKKLSMLGPM